MKDSYIQSDEIAWVDPAALVPNPNNPRIPLKSADPANYAALKQSIERGSFKPILVETGSNEIVDGHQSREVYMDLGRKAPVIYLRTLTAKEKAAINVAANAHAGSWDIPALKDALSILPKDEIPLLCLDAPTLDLIEPPKESQASDPDQKWATLKFKMARESAERVTAVIERVCKAEKVKDGTALERIVEEWAQGTPFYSDAA